MKSSEIIAGSSKPLPFRLATNMIESSVKGLSGIFSVIVENHFQFSYSVLEEVVIFSSLFSSWRSVNHFIVVQFIKNWKSFMKNLIFYCSSVHEVMGRASREASPSKARLLGTWRAKSLTKTTSHENLKKLRKFCTKHGNLETKISHKNRKPWKPG